MNQSFHLSPDNSNGGKVFGLGPGRSGTDSLRMAFIRLGFGPSHHMKEILAEGAGISTYGHIEVWHDLARNLNGEEQFYERPHDYTGSMAFWLRLAIDRLPQRTSERIPQRKI